MTSRGLAGRRESRLLRRESNQIQVLPANRRMLQRNYQRQQRHEYVRHLAVEMGEEWRLTADGSGKSKERREELLILIKDIVRHNMKHNAEVEACDLLEIEKLNLLLEYVEGKFNDCVEVQRQFQTSIMHDCAPLTPDPDNQILIRTAKDLYLKFDKQFDALRCAVILNDVNLIREIFGNCKDLLVKRQIALLLVNQFIEVDFYETRADVLTNTGFSPNLNKLCKLVDNLTAELKRMNNQSEQISDCFYASAS
ncbi:RPN1-RPN2-N domain-containing protein [Aphelenchoides besseyi]|nr:RPN1-RPN2-N domain-containing protein [Aphelenchoides besseyi]